MLGSRGYFPQLWFSGSQSVIHAGFEVMLNVIKLQDLVITACSL
jgi:hypothetical protein